MVYEANDQNFDELIQTDYAVADFYGTYCGPCKLLEPIYEEVSDDLAGIRFVKANTDHCPKLGDRFDIKAVPTLVFLRGGQAFFQECGGMDRKTLESCISRLLYE